MLIVPTDTYRGSVILPIMEWQRREYNTVMEAQQRVLEAEVTHEKKDLRIYSAGLRIMAWSTGVLIVLMGTLVWFVTWGWMRRTRAVITDR